ncbi:DUF6003 family protein [Streptomyces sp. TLI_146]|uniref:DUF6003 family protein n=1 Tax=Streptomyces sp. TLI_146 TaxID=1938858 RepID=UPI0035A65791
MPRVPAGRRLAVLSDEELQRLQEEQSGLRAFSQPADGDVRAELQAFRQTADGRDNLVHRAALGGISEAETAGLSGLSRTTVRTILGKGPAARDSERQGGVPCQSAVGPVDEAPAV